MSDVSLRDGFESVGRSADDDRDPAVIIGMLGYVKPFRRPGEPHLETMHMNAETTNGRPPNSRDTAAQRPYYVPVGDEIEVFRSAYAQRLPIMLKGPTGVGKTRLVEAMAYDLGVDLITVSCHEDLTAADLLGRFTLRGGDTQWTDGPLTEAVRRGAICYLDEVVEARQDTTVVLHSITDHRRMLTLDRLSQTLTAPAQFCLVVSYNPGYQSMLKDLKASTRQRFIGIELDFPPPAVELELVKAESGLDAERAARLVDFGAAVRRSRLAGVTEVASTRTLVAAARLMVGGLSARAAMLAAVCIPLTDDPTAGEGLIELAETYGL